jgi:hypothetical protein
MNKTIRKSKNIKRNTKGKTGKRYILKKGGEPDISTFIFASDKISTQPNSDNSYKEMGVIHYTESAGVNAVRGIATDISNFFGAKGFDNSLIDGLRNSTLNKIKNLITANQKICNLRMEIDNSNPTLIFHHVYGTLLQKEGQTTQPVAPAA